MKQIEVQIAILNYNGKHLLEKFLPSISALNYEKYEIVIIDNASKDNSIDWLKYHYPKIKIIAIDNNLGYAGGYNYAIKQLDAEYILLLNSDVEMTKNSLSPLVQFMKKDCSIAVCQPMVLNYHDKTIFDYAGGAGGYMDLLYYPFCRGRIFDHLEKNNNQYDTSVPIFWASGACMLIRREAFVKIGGFDEQYYMHHEEIDLCWRLQKAGYKIYAIPKSIVYHMGGATLMNSNPKKKYFNHRNNLLMIYKNVPFYSAIPIISLRIIIETCYALAVYGCSFRFRSLSFTLRGILDFFFMILKNALSNKRHKRYTIYNLVGREKIFLFIERYLKNKKRFSEMVNTSKK